MAGAGRIEILMYHSISDGAGPTNIDPAVFAEQIDALAASGLPVITLDDLLRMRRGAAPMPARAVIITFDDGFQDFADTAWPILRRAGMPAINYLPTGHMGGVDAWEGPANPRPIMSWETARRLAGEGALFGSHSVTHPRLDRLTPGRLAQELDGACADFARELGAPPAHFAPPYGAGNGRVRAAIARRHASAVGTRLAPAGPNDDIHDLPRLEMHYFRDPALWRSYLAGRADGALRLRRAARGLRGLLRR